MIAYLSSLNRRPSDIGLSKLFGRPMFGSEPLTKTNFSKRWKGYIDSVWNCIWAQNSISGLLNAGLNVYQNQYDQRYNMIDSVQPMKTDSDNELEEGEMGRVPIDATELSKD